jgi:hypothetical protein
MKRSLTLFSFAIALYAAHPDLSQVRTVYLLPMANGFDQYLANRLTGMGVFQVVTDPQKADAIFTDRLGEPFEQRLSELYPPPAAEPPPEEAKDEKKKVDETAAAELKGDTGRPRTSSIARAKGNVFLVSRASRAVIWSIHQQPKYSSPEALDRNAELIVRKLRDEITGKK